MTWLPLAGLVFAATTATAAPEIHETEAERLHRKGVHCMEVIERSECAIEHFEALLDLDTRHRELLTDGLLRLIRLYRKEGREEEIGPLLRQFWDAGGDRRSRGHVPYSARFLPVEINMMLNIDPPRVLSSALIERGDNVGEYLFTCDDVRRNDIEIEHRWHRAAKRAAVEGRETWELFYEGLEKEWERDRKRAEMKEKREKKQEEGRDAPPSLLFAVSCPLVTALGQTDNRAWRRMTGASHHRERDKVAAIFQIDDLDRHLASAVEAGRLVPDGPGRWSLPDFEFGEQTVRIASLDHDELVVAPVPILDQMQAARRKRKRNMNRELDKLIGKVPKDTGMFVVFNQAALRELGFGDIEKRSLRSTLETLLPRPKGLQVAAVFGDSVGMFTRVPTNSAVRGKMLVSLANALLSRSAEEDEESAKWIEGLDVAEASDRKALLASYVLSQARLEEILFD
ncbi:MAG: hypothetical protein AAF799_39025 [Myxococcota bacterium]